jgi:hypothetical protein
MNKFRAPSGSLPAEATSPEEIARFVVEAAVHAPSVNNTQPWWFSTGEREIGVHADAERRLQLSDPNGREMMISCGAAVFTARVALRYLGFVPKVRVLPDPDLPSLVARIGYGDDQTPPVDYERDLYAEIPRRRSHRGGFDPEPLPSALPPVLREEASREKATLRIMGDDMQRNALSAVVEAADWALRLDSARVHEASRWAPPPGSPRRDGVPATAYPARPERTEPPFPSRDFAHGHGWGLPPTGSDAVPRAAGLAAVLTTAGDHPSDWVSAGQALQRVLLLASSCCVSAALHTQPLELAQLRDFVGVTLCDGAYPQMVLRFGCTGESAVSVRRSIDEVLL